MLFLSCLKKPYEIDFFHNLLEQALIHGNKHFNTPFDRQQLADYLGVDRSALSNELSKMQRDELITFKKNDFTLKK